MLENFIVVAQQVLVLFILISLGFVCGKKKIITDVSAKHINNLVLYFVTPCVMVSAFQRDFTPELLGGLGIMVICATAVMVATILLVSLIFKGKDSKKRVLRFATVFSNCAFMSFPLQEAVLGDDGLFYGAVFVAVFNILVWTYGLVCMSGDIKEISAKKLITNPGIIGVVIAIIIFALNIKLPYMVGQPVEYMAALNTPLPMIIIGYYLSEADLKKAFSNVSVYVAMGLRLVLVPVITAIVLYLCKVETTLAVACVIASAAPTAATTTMFAVKYNKDTELSVSIVAVTTVFSIITMPLVIAFAQTLTA